VNGYESFGYVPADGETDADLARTHTEIFRAAIRGAGAALSDTRRTGVEGAVPINPQSPGLADRIWWGSGTRQTAVWTAEQGMNLMSSTLLSEDTGVPFHQLQAEQIERFRKAWASAGHAREPRVSVSRSIFPIVNDLDHAYFGDAESQDQVGYLDGGKARFGKTYAAEPDELIAQLAADEAIAAADTLLLTIPNQLGVDYCAHVLEALLTDVAPALGWR
jgi:alkanesulfonate monooxygenase SsuD/methylene tetrahydromethanopterin reductase-like flavin-dependent oxidoreductase (luciferase family)